MIAAIFFHTTLIFTATANSDKAGSSIMNQLRQLVVCIEEIDHSDSSLKHMKPKLKAAKDFIEAHYNEIFRFKTAKDNSIKVSMQGTFYENEIECLMIILQLLISNELAFPILKEAPSHIDQANKKFPIVKYIIKMMMSDTTFFADIMLGSDKTQLVLEYNKLLMRVIKFNRGFFLEELFKKSIFIMHLLKRVHIIPQFYLFILSLDDNVRLDILSKYVIQASGQYEHELAEFILSKEHVLPAFEISNLIMLFLIKEPLAFFANRGKWNVINYCINASIRGNHELALDFSRTSENELNCIIYNSIKQIAKPLGEKMPKNILIELQNASKQDFYSQKWSFLFRFIVLSQKLEKYNAMLDSISCIFSKKQPPSPSMRESFKRLALCFKTNVFLYERTLLNDNIKVKLQQAFERNLFADTSMVICFLDCTAMRLYKRSFKCIITAIPALIDELNIIYSNKDLYKYLVDNRIESYLIDQTLIPFKQTNNE